MSIRSGSLRASRLFACSALAFTTLAASCLLSAPAAAQTAPSPLPISPEAAFAAAKADLPACIVAKTGQQATPSGTGGVLVASCNGHPVLLGAADQYDIRTNKALGAVVVDLWHGGARRVLLVSAGPDGGPLVEDLNGEIALHAGKGPMAPIEDVEVDTSGFASEGSVSVQNSSGAVSAASIDLGPQIAAVQAGTAAAAPQQQSQGQPVTGSGE